MTVVYSKDPITGQTVQKIVQYVQDPVTKQSVAQQSWNTLPDSRVDITYKGAALVTTTDARGVKQSVPTTPWEDTAKVIQGKKTYYDYLLGGTGDKENMVVVQGNKMYVAPIAADSLAHGVRRADLTKAREVEYDPYLAEAYRMKQQYGKYGIDISNVTSLTSEQKRDLDTNIKQYQDQYYTQVVRPRHQAELQAMLASGEKQLVRKCGGAIGLVDNPEYFQAKVAYETAQRGMIPIEINGKTHVMTPQQIEEINAGVGKIQQWQQTTQQPLQSSPYGGSIYQDLGVLPKPLGKQVAELPAAQRKEFEEQLRTIWEQSGRPSGDFTRFKNNYYRDPIGYLNAQQQQMISGYTGIESKYNAKVEEFNAAYQRYIANPTSIGEINLAKLEQEALTLANQLNTIGGVTSNRLSALYSLARCQPYNRSRRNLKKRKPTGRSKKSSRGAPPPTRTKQKKKPSIKTKNRLIPAVKRANSYNERFKKVSNKFVGW